MILRTHKGIALNILGASLLGMLASCGGGGGSSSSNKVTLEGSVFASAVDGATCEVLTLDDSIVAGPFTTSADGSYTVKIPKSSTSEDLQVVCTGGTFTDEATGSPGQTAGILSALIAADNDGEVHLTPASTIIHQLITQHGKSAAEAAAAFASAFGYTPDNSVAPTDATAPAQDAETANLLSGLRAAAFSQLAADLGLPGSGQFALLLALAADLSDGTLDGQSSSLPVSIEGTAENLPVNILALFSQAMVNFHNSANNMTGLTRDQIGNLPFAKVAMTDNYMIEYSAMRGAIDGKSEFTLSISDLSDTPQTGLDVSIKPMMYMSNRIHSTPYNSECVEGSTAGKYHCTAYYLMASQMMGGMSMGYWQLKVSIGGNQGESTYFYPTVTMAMGDTAQARLKGQDDLIPGMSADETRTYYLFKQDLSGMTNNHSFALYIAAKESMMSFPAIETGATLSAGETNYELVLSSLSVEVSANASDWITASEQGDGIWIADGISGLTNGEEATLYVRLTINGEQKTTDGMIPNAEEAASDTNNHFAKFTVTPGGGMGMSM